MGSTYEFSCADCGYIAEVSGGPDRGFCVETQTGACLTCDGLVDYAKRILDADATWLKSVKLGVCHQCDTPISRDWNDGDPCPRCGGRCLRGPCTVDWD